MRAHLGDAVRVYRQLALAAQYYPVGEEPTPALSHKANTRFRLSGGMNQCTGATTYLTGEKLCQFLTALRDR